MDFPTTINKVSFLGDLHCNYKSAQKAIRYAAKQGADVIIQVGDFAYNFPEGYLNTIQTECERFGILFLFIDGNHECCSEDMRAVTPNGFKYHYELFEGDLVMSVDDDGNTIWQPVQEVIVRPHNGTMYRLKADGASGLFTPGHRIVYQTYKTGNWKESLAEDFSPNTNTNIVTAGLSVRPDYNISDDMIRLYGWCLTDSYPRENGNWYFCQRASNSASITSILDRLGFSYTTSTRIRNITHIQGKKLKKIPEPEVEVRMRVAEARSLPWRNTNKELWQEVWKFSSRQIDILVRTMIETDGSKATNGHDLTGALYCVTEEINDEFQSLLAANGFRTSRYEPRPGDRRLNICKRNTVTLTKQTTFTPEDYNGLVWCVRVPNGKFFVEHEGRIHLTGNCFDWLYAQPLSDDGTRKLRPLLWHLPRGFRWEWNGVTFLALGGAHSVDRKWRTPGAEWWWQEYLTDADMWKATEPGPVDVMITHDAPIDAPVPLGDGSWIPQPDQVMAYKHRMLLQDVVDIVKPKFLVHGHYHTSYSDVVNKVYYRGLGMDGMPWDQAMYVKSITELRDLTASS